MDANLKRISRAYYRLLCCIDWEDEVVVAGIREGLNKFLSNAWIQLVTGESPGSSAKYKATHWITKAALAGIDDRETHKVFEHVVPKDDEYQSKCEKMAREGTLTLKKVEKILDRHWILATVTKEENRRLSRKMPKGWTDAFARYRKAGITLRPNPHYSKSRPHR